MSGLLSLTATAPTDALWSWPSVTGRQFSPASVVFHKPPPTAPKYASFARPFTPLTAMERPPRSGPMFRHLKLPRKVESGPAGAVAALAVRGWIRVVTGRPTDTTSVVAERDSSARDSSMMCGWAGWTPATWTPAHSILPIVPPRATGRAVRAYAPFA